MIYSFGGLSIIAYPPTSFPPLPPPKEGQRPGPQSRDPESALTSGVPQKVDVVPLCSMFSLQSPKSVRTMCPCESSKIFSGFKSLRGKGGKEMCKLISVHKRSSVKTIAWGIRRFLSSLRLHSE